MLASGDVAAALSPASMAAARRVEGRSWASRPAAIARQRPERRRRSRRARAARPALRSRRGEIVPAVQRAEFGDVVDPSAVGHEVVEQGEGGAERVVDLRAPTARLAGLTMTVLPAKVDSVMVARPSFSIASRRSTCRAGVARTRCVVASIPTNVAGPVVAPPGRGRRESPRRSTALALELAARFVTRNWTWPEITQVRYVLPDENDAAVRVSIVLQVAGFDQVVISLVADVIHVEVEQVEADLVGLAVGHVDVDREGLAVQGRGHPRRRAARVDEGAGIGRREGPGVIRAPGLARRDIGRRARERARGIESVKDEVPVRAIAVNARLRGAGVEEGVSSLATRVAAGELKIASPSAVDRYWSTGRWPRWPDRGRTCCP